LNRASLGVQFLGEEPRAKEALARKPAARNNARAGI